MGKLWKNRALAVDKRQDSPALEISEGYSEMAFELRAHGRSRSMHLNTEELTEERPHHYLNTHRSTQRKDPTPTLTGLRAGEKQGRVQRAWGQGAEPEMSLASVYIRFMCQIMDKHL